MCHAIYIAGAKLAIKPLLAKYYTEKEKTAKAHRVRVLPRRFGIHRPKPAPRYFLKPYLFI